MMLLTLIGERKQARDKKEVLSTQFNSSRPSFKKYISIY
jgi:hypothetical protein